MLTLLQQRQLDELSDWLRRMEALVSEDAQTDEPLQMRLEKHKVCGCINVLRVCVIWCDATEDL